jgi:hypothetical protein
MSITDQDHRSTTPGTDAGSGAPRRRPPLGGRGLVTGAAGVAGVAAVVVVALAVGLGSGSTDGSTTSASGAPRAATHLEAPDQLNGATPVPLAQDATQTTEWKTQAARALNGARYFARTYSTSPTSATTRVVVAATDLTGELEQAWAADAGAAVGDDRCTQNLILGERTGVRPTVSLCWRTTENLSAYVLVIDPRHTIRFDAAAAALDEAWKRSLA